MKTIRTKWDQPTTRTVKIPSLQTILLIVLLVAAMTAIVWISITVKNETPRPPASEPPAEGPAAWLSAVATAIGSVGTAGALLIAAFSYKHQVDEKKRAADERRRQALDSRSAQARAIRLKIHKSGHSRDSDSAYCYIRNDSNAAIDGAFLTVFSAYDQLPTFINVGTVPGGGGESSHMLQSPVSTTSFMTFTDTNGRRWRLYISGKLWELLPDTLDEVPVPR